MKHPSRTLPLVMRMVIYLSKPHLEIASTVRKVIEYHVNAVSFLNLCYMFDGEGNPEGLDSETFAALMTDWFEGPMSAWPNATISFQGAGGSNPEFVVNYCGKALDEIEFPDDRGYLEIIVSKEYFETNRQKLERFFFRTCIALQAETGYLAPAVSGSVALDKQSLAKRYATLDIANPISVSIDLGSRVPGVYWLNYFGRDVASVIREKLSDMTGVRTLEDAGCILCWMSENPQLGDRNRIEDLTSFRRLTNIIHELGLLHIPERYIYFTDAHGLADAEAQSEWYGRFLVDV